MSASYRFVTWHQPPSGGNLLESSLRCAETEENYIGIEFVGPVL